MNNRMDKSLACVSIFSGANHSEDKGRVIAKVYPHYDLFDESFASFGPSEPKRKNRIIETLEAIQEEVSQKLPTF